MAVILPAAIGVAGGIYKAYQGYQDSKEAKKLAAAPRPQYQIPQTEYDNLNYLTNRASDGLSAQTKQLYMDNADRGMTTGISAILQGGGNPNDIATLYDKYLGNTNNVAMENNKANVENVDNLINARYRQSGYLDKQWTTNTFGPWADQQKKAAQLAAAGKGEMNAGINSITGGLMSGVNAYNNEGDVSSVTGAGGGQGSSAGSGSGMMGAPSPGAPQGGDVPGGNFYPYVDISSSSRNVDNPRMPLSPDSPGGGTGTLDNSNIAGGLQPQEKPYMYGLDVSRMHPNDASMFGKLLFGQ